MKRLIKNRWVWIVLILFITLGSIVIYYHSTKPLPKGISYEGEEHKVKDIEFLYDLTYENKNGETTSDQEIFSHVFKMIDEADEFIVMDMFLFNGYREGNREFPALSKKITDKLLAKKEQNKDLKIVVITDKINTSYGTKLAPELAKLKNNGIDVVITDVDQLRDSNPLYSAFWRSFLQWFGQEGTGWIPNTLAKQAPKVTLRAYLEMMNIKANHRKVMATEDEAMISTANPHDESAYHSNIALKVKGNIIKDVLESEDAVSAFSKGPSLPEYQETVQEEGDIKIQLLTEGKIYKHLLKELRATQKGEEVWIGMFYLADREVVTELEDAAKRGAKIRLVLDPNKVAFGTTKTGLPNIPVAKELIELGNQNIEVRWYNAGFEQYHTKLLLIKRQDESVVLGGSANYTRRNLDDYNLESDLKVTAPTESDFAQEVEQYFHKIWTNKDGKYTVSYEKEEKLPLLKYVVYRIQKVLHFTTY